MSELAARKLPAINLDDFERRLRHTPDATQTSEDPLSALARLVHKNDPFQSVFDAGPARAAAPDQAPVFAPAPQKTQAPLIDFNAPQQADAQRSYGAEPQHEPAYADAEAQNAAEAQDYEAAAAADAHYDEVQLQAGAQDSAAAYAPSLRQKFQIPRKALFAGVALSVVAVAGVATAIGFRGLPMGKAAVTAPVIKAATGPVKVQPPVSEGADVASAPSVLDKGAPADGAANSKVVSREEQPTDIAPTVKTVKTIKIGDGAAPANGGVAVVAPGASSLPEPKKVKTVLVRPDGSIVGEQPAAAAPSIASLAAGQTPSPKAPEVKLPVARAPEAAPVKAAAAPAVVTPAPAKAATRVVPAAPAKAAPAAEAQDNGAGPLQIAPGGKAKPIKTASRDVSAAPAAADDTVQTTGSTTGGAFAVQLAAPASEQEAKDAAARAQKQYASALGGHQPTIRKASDKEVYRVRVSNLSKDEADALCGKLKAAGGACFVAHN